MPATRSVPGSTTITSPMFFSAIRRAAAVSGASRVTVSGAGVITSRTWTSPGSPSEARAQPPHRAIPLCKRWIGAAPVFAPSVYPAPKLTIVLSSPMAGPPSLR